MGGKPTVPDPHKVAQAQTAQDIGTAIANTYMGNADTYGPLGSTIYNKTGEQKIHIPGPNGGTTYKIPTWTVKQNLSPDQMQMLNLQEKTGINLGETAVAQSRKIGNLLNTGINANSLPSAVTNAPNAPSLTSAGGLTPAYQNSIPLRPLQSRVNLGNQATTFGNAGDVQRQIGADDFSADRTKVEQAILSRLNPEIDRDRAELQTRLANQGVTQDSAAYRQAIDELNRQVTDQRMQAVLAGGQEQSRLFGMDATKGQFANQAQQQAYDQLFGRAQFGNQAIEDNNAAALQEGNFYNTAQGQGFQQDAAARQFYNQVQQQEVQDSLRQAEHFNQVRQGNFDLRNTETANQQTLRQQALQEQVALRNQPISEIGALLNGSQPTMPQFQQFQAGHIPSTPIGQYMYQSAALQNQQSNAAMGGMFGLGSSFLGMLPMLSDRRAKEDIQHVGKLDNGLSIYLFTYKVGGSPQLGLMADEVEKIHPEAVTTIGPHGLQLVDYELAVQPVGA